MPFEISKYKHGKFLLLFLILFGFLAFFWYFVIENQEIHTSLIKLKDIKWLTKSGKIVTENNETKMVPFTISDLSPKELQIANSNSTYKNYLDPEFLKDCAPPHPRKELFDILKFWINFSATHDIPWWMIYGSLIGTLRHKDMIPWDHDIDIGMPSQYENLLRNLSTPRSSISNNKVNIITRPGAHCPYNGPRMDCNGNMVSSQVDGCAFCGPFARLFFSPSKRIDIYLYEIQIKKNELKIIDDGSFEYMSEAPTSPIDWYFPLRNCTFMNLVVQCPRKSEIVLNDFYKSFKSTYKCVKGSWIKI